MSRSGVENWWTDWRGNNGETDSYLKASVPCSTGLVWCNLCLCFYRSTEEERKIKKLILKCSHVLWQVSIHLIFVLQVSSSASPQASLESHVFNVAVLPQTPRAPQLSLGSSLHMAVSVCWHHWLLFSMFIAAVQSDQSLASSSNCWMLVLAFAIVHSTVLDSNT